MNTRSRSFFASRSVPIHLVRGAAAMVCVIAAVWLQSIPGILGGIGVLAALVATVFLLRGCPTCWLIGLFATMAHRAKGGGRLSDRDHGVPIVTVSVVPPETSA